MIALCASLAGFLVLDRVQSSSNPLSPDSAAGSTVPGSEGTALAGLSLPDASQPVATMTPDGNPLAALIREVADRRDVGRMAVRDAFQPGGPWRVAAPAVVEARPAPSNTAAFIDRHKLTATLSGAGGGSAVINGRFCSVGEVVGGFRLVAVDERSATLESEYGTAKLLLSTTSD